MLKRQIIIFLLLTLSFSFAQAQTFKEGVGVSLDVGLIDSSRDEDKPTSEKFENTVVIDTEMSDYLNPTVNLEYSYFPNKTIRIKPYIGMNLSVISKLFFAGISNDFYILPLTRLKTFYPTIGLHIRTLVSMSDWHHVTLGIPLKLEYYIKPAAAIAFVLEPYFRLYNDKSDKSEENKENGVSARLMFSYYFGG